MDLNKSSFGFSRYQRSTLWGRIGEGLEINLKGTRRYRLQQGRSNFEDDL